MKFIQLQSRALPTELRSVISILYKKIYHVLWNPNVITKSNFIARIDAVVLTLSTSLPFHPDRFSINLSTTACANPHGYGPEHFHRPSPESLFNLSTTFLTSVCQSVRMHRYVAQRAQYTRDTVSPYHRPCRPKFQLKASQMPSGIPIM